VPPQLRWFMRTAWKPVKRSLSDAAEVVAVTGAFETMNDYDDRRFLALARLPVAMSEQAGFRDRPETAWPQRAGDRSAWAGRRKRWSWRGRFSRVDEAQTKELAVVSHKGLYFTMGTGNKPKMPPIANACADGEIVRVD